MPGKEAGTFEANERYKDVPGAVLRFGNLPRLANASVHSGEDVILTASGPGSERVRGQMDNTGVFRLMVEALGLGNDPASSSEAYLNRSRLLRRRFRHFFGDCRSNR